MWKKIISIFHEIICNNLYKLVQGYQNEIYNQTLSLNITRIKKTVSILIFWNLLMIFIDLVYYRSKWKLVNAYQKLFYSHLVFEVILIFFCIFYMQDIKLEKHRSYKFVNLCFIMSATIWCEFLSINAQFIHGQISAYIICMFCIASIVILNPHESLVIYSLSYITFVIGMFLAVRESYELSGHVINSFFSITFSFIISRSSFITFIKHIINENIIASKNEEIDKLNKALVKKVEAQTDELIYVNENLELEKLRVSLFANISHEFKTPLNVILSAEQLVKYKLIQLLDSDNYKSISKHMFSIRQNCYRLIRLVSNIVDITKIDCGSMGIRLENRDIVKTIEDIVLSVADFIKSKNIELTFDTQIEEKLLAIDVDKIERVILNLLSNAVKFTPPNGSIFVCIFEEKDKIIISVKDTGIGIPLEMQKAIFDRFVQVDKSLTKNSEGSGIGLSLSKSIIELHKGNIYVVSQIGIGSEFIIELPIRIIEQDSTQISDNLTSQQHIEKIKIEFSDMYL